MPATATDPRKPGSQRRYQCRHIFTDGHRCGSPCLRGEEFCFYHHSARRAEPAPTSDLSQGEHQASTFTLPHLEDRAAIQLAIGQVLNRLANNELDPRRAGLLLYGLQIASHNLPPQRASARPEPQQALVEEVVADPDLGPIAPTNELSSPENPGKPTTLTELFLEELARNAPNLPPLQPAPPRGSGILPHINACAACPTPPLPLLSSTQHAHTDPPPHRPHHPRWLGLSRRDRRQRHRPRP